MTRLITRLYQLCESDYVYINNIHLAEQWHDSQIHRLEKYITKDGDKHE